MAKRSLSVDERSWVQQNWTNPTEVARYLGVCRDTAIRILVREGMTSGNWGAKYTRNPASDIEMWQRPCMNPQCRCTKPRPKWQYRCDTCKGKAEKDFLF